MSKSRAPLFIGIAIVAMLAGVLVSEFMRAPAQPIELSTGTLLPTAREMPQFQLIDSNGQPYAREQLLDRWSVLFFGFTNCPDICPTTLTTLAQVEKSLADLPEAQRPRMVFVAVDSKRDTPTQVASYIEFFSPQFVGITGDAAHMEQFTRDMGVPVAIHDTGEGAYTVDHAATLFLVDPKARMRAVFSPPHQVNTLAADLRHAITSLTQ